MDGRKSSGKIENKSKPAKRRMSFQEFIDGINVVLEERKEIEELFRRVLFLTPEKVLEEMEIKRKNNEILEAHMRAKSENSNKLNEVSKEN